MGGYLRVGVGLLATVLSIVAVVGPAAAQTYAVTGDSYSVTKTLPLAEDFDSHELVAGVGKVISYSVQTVGGGCVMLILTLGHNVNDQSYYLPAYSQETCVTSYSKSYTVPSGGGPDFSIVILTEIAADVTYKLDITMSQSNPALGLLGGILILVVIGAIIGGISYALRRRKAARAPPPYVPPPYPTEYPPQAPAQPPIEPPMQPGAPPPPPQ